MDKKETLKGLIYKAEVEIKCEKGLGINVAIHFADIAKQFGCEIAVHYGETVADGKSFLLLYLLGATNGSKIKIRAKGPNAQEAIDTLIELVKEKRPDKVKLNNLE